MNFYVKRYGEFSRRARRPGEPNAKLHWLWSTLIALYFIAGFVILFTRWFVTTQLDDHLAAIESAVTDAFGVVVNAEHIEGGFHLIRPTLVLTNATLSRPGGPVSLTLPKVEAEFSWSSLWHLEPRFHALVVTAPKLTVRRLEKYKFDIAGFVLDAEEPAEESKPDSKRSFTSWLLGQDQLILKNGDFTYIDETRPNALPVTIRSAQAVFDQRLLDWRAAVRATLAEGKTVKHFEAKARIEKGLFTRSENPLTWKGEAYFHSDRINGASLLQRIGLSRYARSGEGAARAWVQFESGRVVSATADLALGRVVARFNSTLPPVRLSHLSGRFTYENDGAGGHAVAASALEFAGSDRRLRFGPAEITSACDTDASGSLLGCSFSASEISIDTLSQLAPSLPIPDSARSFLKSKPVSGMLRNVSASVRGDFANPANWSFNGGFTGLTLPAGDDALPGFRNLSGAVASARPGEFDLTLESYVSQLTFPGVFREPKLNFDAMTGFVRVRTDPHLRLDFENIRIKNGDASVTGSGSWEATGGAGTIDIGGEILSARAESVHKYLPNVVGDAALDYVEAGVRGGKASAGTWVVRGRLDDFPWDGPTKGLGIFKIETDVSGGILDFMPSHRLKKGGGFVAEEHWPLLTGIDAHLLFEGNRMLITGRRARSMKLAASAVRVEIPSYTGKDARLLVNGRIESDLGDALGYLNGTPFLRDILGDSFKDAKGKGRQTSLLTLSMPLQAPEKTKYAVESTLANAEFQYLPILPVAQKLGGSLLFDNAGIHAKAPLTGTLSGAPLRVSAATEKGTFRLDIEGRLTPEDGKRMLAQPWSDPLFGQMLGHADTRVRLELPLTEPAKWSLAGSSDLAGLALTLPEPFAKTEAAEWPVSFSWTPAGDKHRELRIALEKRADIDMHFEVRKEGHAPAGGTLALGTTLKPRTQGFDVAVAIPNIDLDAWSRLMSASGSVASASKEELLKTLEGDFLSQLSSATLKTEALRWSGETFDNIDSTLRHVDKIWHLRLQSEEAAGQVEFREPPSADGQPTLSVKLLRLHLPAAAESAMGEDIARAPRNWLPNLDVVVDDLRIGKRNIGKVEINARNLIENGRETWQIDHFAVRNRGGTLLGTGGWQSGGPNDPTGRSAVSLKADVRSVGEVLQSLDVVDVIHDAPGSLTLKADWKGMPVDFNFETLNGEIVGRTGAGQLIQIEPGAGRLLSLLSMQHLLRRLTLDFRDVAGRGFGFDSLSVNSTIANGMLHTEKSSMIGSAATVLIGGDVDLVNEVLDLKAIVLPSINAEGASLALAIANPAVGIGTLLAQFVLKDQISKMLSSEYEIRGTYDAPDIQKISRPFAGGADNEPLRKN